MTRGLAVMVVLGFATRAVAAPVDDLETQGEELARVGDYTKAIDAFKEADRAQPRARHACMIGLAYLRRELWSEAELYFDKCKATSSVVDPLPDWFQGALAQLAQKLAGINVSQVTITVSPPTAHASIRVSTLAAGETIGPRAIHLAPGPQTIWVTAPGFVDQRRDFLVYANSPLLIDVVLSTPEQVRAQQKPSRIPWIVLGAGAAFGLGGGILHATVLRSARDDVAAATTGPRPVYDDAANTFRRDRAIVIGLYAGAAIAITTGLILRHTLAPNVEVSGQLDKGGAMVGIAWSR